MSSVVGRLLGLSSAVPVGPCDALFFVFCIWAGASPCRWVCCMAAPCVRVGVIVQVPFEMVQPELAMMLLRWSNECPHGTRRALMDKGAVL